MSEKEKIALKTSTKGEIADLDHPMRVRGVALVYVTRKIRHLLTYWVSFSMMVKPMPNNTSLPRGGKITYTG